MVAPHIKPASLVYTVMRTGLGIVFIWASWDKILYPDKFAAIVANYDILPVAAVNLAALVLPWIELLCGLLLLGGRLVPGAALTINILLVVFILATAYNLYRGLDINCGCFSVAPAAKGQTVVNLVRNGFLLTVGIWLLLGSATSRQATVPDREAER